ncbi:MAG: hypothetical protein JNM21_14385 [Taibaiella sp.]|nr:hypothetical protein [Taibaiella sp.]
MKRLLTLLGGGTGLLYAIWDTMINGADTAPLEHEFVITIVSWPFFITKIIVYLLIGAVLGWLIGFMVDKARKRK